ncbi:MAG: RNA 2',3'-cyclic phosphodiesterase [Candidatus Eisenbacteria bacterium]|uniref:RNA 2',3'-cyclic phosphodiesterase n=1 Tax=Eiseniibacteriota bacterium TaxID=2212470 RepID=A0A956M0L0_UNCEI|nr:RNA 2',3'-cyclic phosphodiesterase [Candidatus Eisenbacteria bacterium]
MNDRVRAFLAIEMPGELIADAADVQAVVRERIEPVGRGTVRWVDPRSFHLTVRFFGDLDRRGVERARDVVRGTRFDRIPVRMGKVSAFPSVSRPQVLWVGLEDGGGTLPVLVERLDHRLREAGFGPPDKPWKSHLTFGRVARGARLPDGWHEGIALPASEYRLDSIALMRSELLPTGARYTALERVTAGRDDATG